MFRPPFRSLADAQTRPAAHSSGESFGAANEDYQMALLALSHTPLEDELYRVMLSAVATADQATGVFSVKGLKQLTGINSHSTIRRGLSGLERKLSIKKTRSDGTRLPEGHSYQIFMPVEIFERRRASGIPAYPKEIITQNWTAGFDRAVERVAREGNLSRREAQVALACAEGMTNAEIGNRLSVSEQTVKFHLRNIFTKFGVRRRTELVSRLLVHEDRARAAP